MKVTPIKNYNQQVVVITTAKAGYQALTEQIQLWWSDVEGHANQIGSVFTVSFGPESYWTFKVIQLDPPYDIIWQCIESHQDHHLPGMDAEWRGSKLFWHIMETDDGIQIDFEHEGLETTGVCYEVCSAGWDFYILKSLKQYLETGLGQPGGN